jgi:predicted esterase
VKMLPGFCAVSLLIIPVTGRGQNYAPPPAKAPNETTLKAIETKAAKLDRAMASLRRQGLGDPWLAEVQIYHKAATWIVQHNEFYVDDAPAWTQEVLDRGLLRAGQAAQGEYPWVWQFGNTVVRAYRSRVDGSLQPYAVTWPMDYGKDPRKKWRLDVVLHGRDAGITEVKFLHQHRGDQDGPKAEFIRLEVFGRGNNAYRWAGETDIIEAIDAFVAVERLLGRVSLLDPARIVLRGFSMGGAGTWHLGLHRPDRWCVIGPGAGFTTTHGYLKGIPDVLIPYQEACLRIYDAVAYAENAFNVPVVAYSGAEDPQMAAARNIEERLKPLGIPMKHLLAPGLAHQFPQEWQQKAEEAYTPYAKDGIARAEYPQRVRFVTYTLKYPSCFWVETLGLDRHYERTLVDAKRTDNGFSVQTQNVRELRLALPENAFQSQVIIIDNQEVKTQPHANAAGRFEIFLENRGKQWRSVLPQKIAAGRFRHPRKVAGLQGPIDDAFMESFLCVRGTGPPWNEGSQKYAEANLDRFSREWDKYMRGKLPVKDDVEITDEDIANRHLILFGDPASNTIIANVIDGLPLQWTEKTITLGAGPSFPSADHLPVMIYPSPLNPSRYVVLNSGHTFHEDDFRGTNALLYPRLGDYAILKLKATQKNPLEVEIAGAGLFNDDWQVTKP